MLADEMVMVAPVGRFVAGGCSRNFDLGNLTPRHERLEGAIHRRQPDSRAVPARPLADFLRRQRLARLAQNAQNHFALPRGIAHIRAPLD